MPGAELIVLAALAVAAWLWLDSLRAREAAIVAARAACTAEGLLLLDDTVAIMGIQAVRDDDGRLQFKRSYGFEYSDTGNNRLAGSVVLIGRRVAILNLAPRARPSLPKLY